MTRNSSLFWQLLSLFIIFISSMQFVKSESEITKLPGQRFTTEEEIKSYLNKTDVTVLAFFYKEESDKSNQVAKNLKIVYSKLQYLAEFILVDCDKSHMSQCKPSDDDDMEDNFFHLEIYVPPQYKYNPYTKELNTYTTLQYTKKEITDKAIYKALTKMIISREQKVSNENYENFRQKNDLNKVLLFTNKKTSPLLFRGLSGYFYDRLLFGVVPNTEKQLCEKLNIKKFPTLMVIQTIEDGVIIDEPIEIEYKGELDAPNIVKFLNNYALEEKLYLQKDDEKENQKFLMYFFKLTAENAMEFMTKKKDKEVIFYFDNKVKDGKITYDNLSEDIKEFNTETHGFFLFGYIDCTGEEKEKICSTKFKVKEFPYMVLYRPENEVKEKISKGAELPMEIENIRREINLIFEPNIKAANPYNFQQLLVESVGKKKISLLYLFDGNIGLGFGLLTLKEMFKDLFDFIIMDNPPKEIKKNLQCTKLPYISIVIPDETRTDNNGNPETRFLVYNGKFSYSGLYSFLTSSFAVKNKGSDSNSSSKGKDDKKPAKIVFIQNTKDLVDTCTKKKLCIIGFFDMRANEESQKKFNESFAIFKNFTEVSKKRPTTFGYVNATCQEEFTSKFGVNIESLPSVIIYSYQKDVYSNLVGTFSVEDMSELITKTISGRINFQRMQKDNAVLQDIKCETIQPYVNTDDDDDDIMKELLAEEKKKREEFDKERNADEGKKKKKKKKKGKKKKDKSSDL